MQKQGVHDRFFALLAKMPGADKEELVWQFSNMRTMSLREFHDKDIEGYKRMIATMQVAVNKQSVDSEQVLVVKRLRSAILYRLQKHGVDTTDWWKVNSFLQQPRIAGKRLYDMNIEEMSRLIHKLEAILTKDAKVKEQEHRLTTMN